MSEPRIFQGWPLTEVPLAFLAERYDTDRIKRENAAEVAPGIFVQVMAHGDFTMPDGKVTGGARIAVWDERTDHLFFEQLKQLVEELHGRADAHQDEREMLPEGQQQRASYLSGLEFAFDDAAYMLSKLIRLRDRAQGTRKGGQTDA